MKLLKNKYFFFFIIIGELVLAQGGWKKRYHLQNSLVSVCRNVIECPNGDLIMVGLTYETKNNQSYNRLTILGTDPNGNMLWRKDYGNYKFEYLDNIFAPRAAIVQEGNFFYHTLSVRDSTDNRSFGVLIKFNYNGDTLWQKTYSTGNTVEDLIPQALTKSVDGGFLITGLFQHWGNNTRLCLLIKTDRNGKELWRRKISKAVPNVQDGRSIVQDTNTKKIVIVGYQYIGSSTYQETFSNILILDSLGNKLLQRTFNNANGGGFAQVIQLKDKNFLTGCSVNTFDDIGALTRYKPLLVKFDINGNVIWSKTYDTLSPFAGICYFSELANGDIMSVGGLDTLRNYNILGPVKIKLYKADKDGNLKWKKYIGSAYSYTNTEYPRSLNPTRDGGFVISAWMPNAAGSFTPPYSVIKVDSTGCDTLEAWCRSVALGVSNFNKLSGYNFEVFPNPASNFINLKIDAPQDKNFVVRINDISGRLVEEVQITSEKNYELNISRFEAGVYFVNVVYEGNAVKTKRLVIVR